MRGAWSEVAARPVPVEMRASAVEGRLAGVMPDELSPREALALVYELKGLAKG